MPIPCPHFKITIVKRSQGQSAVAGAAYQSGERLFSEYDQKTKFYNKKKELVHAEIMLPSHAPPGFADRATLWNAVEAVENQWNSQLARRIVLAFPVEIINNSLFEQCDNALRQLLLQQNIPDEMEDLYKILLSAEMLAQDSSTTILETYSIYTVDDIRTRLKKLDSLLELNSDFNYTITTDENDIRQRKRVDLMGLLMIHENLNYFSRLYKN